MTVSFPLYYNVASPLLIVYKGSEGHFSPQWLQPDSTIGAFVNSAGTLWYIVDVLMHLTRGVGTVVAALVFKFLSLFSV